MPRTKTSLLSNSQVVVAPATAPQNSPADEPQPPTAQPKVSALYFVLQDNSEIGPDKLERVKAVLGEMTGEHLYIVIRSIGGDAYSAVRIMKHVRTKFRVIDMVIQDYCYSAATLMSLGANSIFVAPEGYIGPIDKPLEHDTGEQISALDVTQSVSNLYSLVSTNAQQMYKDIRTRSSDRISKRDALQVAWDSAVKLMCPLIEKMDPILLQKAFRDLRIGMLSGLDLLATHEPDFYKRLRIVQTLVNQYPSHGYAIFREEMQSIELPTKKLEDCPDTEKLLSYYNQPSAEIFFIANIYAEPSNV